VADIAHSNSVLLVCLPRTVSMIYNYAGFSCLNCCSIGIYSVVNYKAGPAANTGILNDLEYFPNSPLIIIIHLHVKYQAKLIQNEIADFVIYAMALIYIRFI
jgi:hypothetical protein